MYVFSDVGRRLSLIRKDTGKTQEEFSDFIGVARQSVIKYEQGDRKIDAAVLTVLTESGYNINWLLAGTGKMKIKDHEVMVKLREENLRMKNLIEKVQGDIDEISREINPSIKGVNPKPA